MEAQPAAAAERASPAAAAAPSRGGGGFFGGLFGGGKKAAPKASGLFCNMYPTLLFNGMCGKTRGLFDGVYGGEGRAQSIRWLLSHLFDSSL